MGFTVLHLLSQRPQQTGSGIALDAYVSCAAANGWRQVAVVGAPMDGPPPVLGGLGADALFPLYFGTPELPFPLPGMSDVMPYETSRFSAMTDAQLSLYRHAWKRHLAEVIARTQPDIIHSHHVWLMSSLIKDVAPHIPVVTQCHATGIRQMALCPHLAQEAQAGCRRNDAFFALTQVHAAAMNNVLGIAPERVHVVGMGYREAVFHAASRIEPEVPTLVYVGKLSNAKGLPWLLRAVGEHLAAGAKLRLHVVGSGAGEESERIRAQMKALGPSVHYHGQLDQVALGNLLRQSIACVLPSFYEGLPLVLVEALACGCRVICTTIPGVMAELVPHFGDGMDLIPLPRMVGIDTPQAEDLPQFQRNIHGAIRRVLTQPSRDVMRAPLATSLQRFTWSAIFGKVESVWKELIHQNRTAG